MDLRLTDDGNDLAIINGELQFVTGKGAAAQDIKMAWQTWLGETPYDRSAGVPYLQVIFKEKNTNLNAVRFILKQIAERRPGVINVDLTVELDSATRELTVSGTAETIDGEIDLRELFGGGSIV